MELKKMLKFAKKHVTLKDFEIRYRNIRSLIPNIKKCSVKDCLNPRDFTPELGPDTCCAYHRLLFDYWSSDLRSDPPWSSRSILQMSQKSRRRAFTNWMNKTGKRELDKIVLKLAQDPINWRC